MTTNTLLPGDNIVFKGVGSLYTVLSAILCLKDKTWKARTWKGWHTGYVVEVLPDGSIVTSQAVNMKEGVCAVTYDSIADMGDCRIYHWLTALDQERISKYANDMNGAPYNPWAYPLTVITYLLNIQADLIVRAKTCWQNVADFNISMGRPMQPIDRFPMISNMMTAWETNTPTLKAKKKV